MPKVRIAGDPGTTYTNDTGKVLFQFICNWANSCGQCCQFDRMVGTSWPIPLHRGCRCHQLLCAPGMTAEPFVDFRAKIQELEPHQQSRVIGASNLAMVEKGLAKWDDVVTSTRIRDFREVVSRQQLTVKQMVKAGVSPRQAENAFESVHTPAHELAAQQRRDLFARLDQAGITRDVSRQALAERLAARVGIGQGPSGPQPSLITPTKPTPPGPAPQPVPKPGPKPGPVPPVRKIARPKPPPPVPAIAGGAPTLQEQHLAGLGVNRKGLEAVERAEWAKRVDTELTRIKAEFAPAKAALETAEAQFKAYKQRTQVDRAEYDRLESALRAAHKHASELGELGKRYKRWTAESQKNPDLIPPFPIEERLAIYARRKGQAKVDAVLALGKALPDAATELARVEAAKADLQAKFKAAKWGSKEHEALADELNRLNVERRRLAGGKVAPPVEAIAKALAPGQTLPVKGVYDDPSAIPGNMDLMTPAMRAEAERGLEFIGRIVSKAGLEDMAVRFGKLPANSASRSHCKEEGIVLEEGVGAHVTVHEFGHYLEFHTGAGQSALDFLRHRVGDEKPQKMADLFPGSAFTERELGRKDRFDEAFPGRAAWYIGKDYNDAASEITSMGLEELFSNPVHFAQKDPEYFMFIAGVADGSLR